MPFYYGSEAIDVLQQHEEGQDITPTPEAPGTFKTIGMGLARGGLKLAKGALITASALNENPEGLYRLSDKYLEPAIKSMTPDPHSVSTAGQILGAISELPGQLLLGPVGLLNSVTMNTGADLVDAGVSPGAATLAAVGTGAATAGMIGLPQAGTSIAKTAGLVALNPVMGAATDAALKSGLDSAGYHQQADAIDPLNPASRAVDLIMGGVFGTLGYRGHLITERARTQTAEGNAKLLKQYQTFVDQLGGHDAIMERLPVEVVDALSVASDYQKRLESNPYDAGASDWLGVHINSLEKALSDIQETGKVDVSGTIPDPRREWLGTMDQAPAEMTAPAFKGNEPLEVMVERGAMNIHGEEVISELHSMGGSEPAADEPAVGSSNSLKDGDANQLNVAPVDEYANETRRQRLKAFREKYGYDPGAKAEATLEPKAIDPLSHSVDSMFAERGDFTVYQGKDADGTELHVSAKELVDTAREELTRVQEMENVYQQAAVCLGLGGLNS